MFGKVDQAAIDVMLDAIEQVNRDGVLHAKYFDAMSQLHACLQSGELFIVTKADMDHYERIEREALPESMR